MLPRVGGFELLAEWRADPRTTELPIFVLTSKELTAQEKKLPARECPILVPQTGIPAGRSAEAITTRRGQAAGGEGMKKRVLVVEDNPLNSELLRDGWKWKDTRPRLQRT